MGLDVTGIGAVSSLIQDVVDKIFPDKVAQAKDRADYLLKAQALDNQLMQGQMAINQAEATNENLFVSGWRPFFGWVCGIAFGYHMILQPVLTYYYTIHGLRIDLPVFDTNTFNLVAGGLLGLNTILRTTEKMGTKGHLPWQQ